MNGEINYFRQVHLRFWKWKNFRNSSFERAAIIEMVKGSHDKQTNSCQSSPIPSCIPFRRCVTCPQPQICQKRKLKPPNTPKTQNHQNHQTSTISFWIYYWWLLLCDSGRGYFLIYLMFMFCIAVWWILELDRFSLIKLNR